MKYSTWYSWSLILFYGINLTAAGDYEMCVQTHIGLDHIGDTGNITTKGWPGNFKGPDWNKPSCSIDIKTCAHCRVQLNVEEVDLPPCVIEHKSGGCIPNCDHIMIFEPQYEEFTRQHIVQGTSLTNIISISNKLYIKFCDNYQTRGESKKFRITYQVLDKTFYYPKEVNLVSGAILAPNFPHGYSRDDEIYTYVVNAKPGNRIVFEFDDWNVSPGSVLHMYDWDEHLNEIATYTGRQLRPALVQSSHYAVKLVFHAFSDGYLSSAVYMGFKISFKFVPKTYEEQPRTGCGNFYRSLLGGNFHLEDKSCYAARMMECIWVVTRYYDHRFDHLSLNIYLGQLLDDEFLEIRLGNYSEGNLLERISSSTVSLTKQFFARDSFYIHLRAKCVYSRNLFKATFASYANASEGHDNRCIEGLQFHCHDKPMCIARQLHCDKFDHCFDGSDERHCQERTTTISHTGRKCSNGYFECDEGRHYFCTWEKCDGVLQCSDGLDETACNSDTPSTGDNPNASYPVTWSIYIPIGLACVTAAIVVCMIVSFCTRRKHLLRRRQQRNAQRNLATPYQFNEPRSGFGIYNIENDYLAQRDAPPTYEEAVHHTQPFMFNNMGFTRSDSTDGLSLPPPYSTRGDDAIIPPPRPGQRHQSPPRIPLGQRPRLHSVQDLPPQVQGQLPSGRQGNSASESDVDVNNRRQGLDNPSFETEVPTVTAQPRSIVGMADIGIRFSDLRDDSSNNLYRTAANHSREQGITTRTEPKTEESGSPKISPKVSVKNGVSETPKNNQKPMQESELPSQNTGSTVSTGPSRSDSESTSYV